MSFNLNPIKYKKVPEDTEDIKFGEDSDALDLQLKPAPALFILNNILYREIKVSINPDMIQFSSNEKTINKIKSQFNYYFNPISYSEESNKYQISAYRIKSFFNAVITVQKENPKLFISSTLFQKTIQSLDIYQQLTKSDIQELTSSLRLLPTQTEFEEDTKMNRNVDSAIFLAQHYTKNSHNYTKNSHNNHNAITSSLNWFCQANSYAKSQLDKYVHLDLFLHTITTISTSSIFDKENDNLLESLAKSTSLTELCMDVGTNYDITKTKQIGKLLALSQSIKKIYLGSVWSAGNTDKLNERTVTPIAEALETNASITTLDVVNTPIGNKGLVQIMNAIEKNPNSKMTSINCASCGITDAITENILSFLKLAPNPIHIHIIYNYINKENTAKIERAIEERAQELSLVLHHSYIQ